tara:strand:- start:4584 stop:5348 length:765 start_codon:yes stop_codon:yes gene_type:complete
MSMTIAELRPALLLAMLEAHNDIPDDEEDFQFDLINDVFLKYDLDAKRRSVELCAKEFRDQGLIEIEEITGTEDETYFRCSMTAKGIDQAEQLAASQTNTPTEQSDGMIAEGAVLQSTASTSPSFITTGALGREPIGRSPIVGGIEYVPAAGRYVSVKDNQPAFDEVRKNISDIRNEFANDHNKRELPVENLDGVIAELDAFDLQIEKNWVSRPAAKNFIETLKYIETVCVTSAKILGAITAIIGSLTIIFGLM